MVLSVPLGPARTILGLLTGKLRHTSWKECSLLKTLVWLFGKGLLLGDLRKAIDEDFDRCNGLAPEAASGSGRFPANDIVAFDNGCHTHLQFAVLATALNANYLSGRADEDLGTVGNLSRQSQCDVQFGARLQILINNEIQAACRNIPRLTVLLAIYALRGDSYNDG